MKLYFGAVSGNSYKVRILLALTQAPHEVVMLDMQNKEHKAPAFLRLSPRGEVPVLEDGGVVLWDSSAILAYIARKHGGERWLPSEPEPSASKSMPGRTVQDQQWCTTAQRPSTPRVCGCPDPDSSPWRA